MEKATEFKKGQAVHVYHEDVDKPGLFHFYNAVVQKRRGDFYVVKMVQYNKVRGGKIVQQVLEDGETHEYHVHQIHDGHKKFQISI